MTERSEMLALAPCPFCGGEAERIDIPTVGSDPELGGDPNAGGSCISCKRCAASTALHFDRKENLYSSWNDRATQVVDREAVARALCESGKFETGEGTCALLCMNQLGSARKNGCSHSAHVFGSLADRILSLPRPAEPVEAAKQWFVCYDGFGGYYVSDTAKDQAVAICFDEDTVENIATFFDERKPTTPDAVGEPVAWDHRVLCACENCTEHAPENSVFAREDIGVMPDGTWLCENCYSDCEKTAYGMVANDSDDFEYPRFEDLPRPSLYTHPPKSPDTSAAVLQSHALKQALDCLSEIAAAHIPDCPAHYAGDELSWAQRHVGSLRHKAEIARDGIAAAIRQLLSPERGDK